MTRITSILLGILVILGFARTSQATEVEYTLGVGQSVSRVVAAHFNTRDFTIYQRVSVRIVDLDGTVYDKMDDYHMRHLSVGAHVYIESSAEPVGKNVPAVTDLQTTKTVTGSSGKNAIASTSHASSASKALTPVSKPSTVPQAKSSSLPQPVHAPVTPDLLPMLLMAGSLPVPGAPNDIKLSDQPSLDLSQIKEDDQKVETKRGSEASLKDLALNVDSRIVLYKVRLGDALRSKNLRYLIPFGLVILASGIIVLYCLYRAGRLLLKRLPLSKEARKNKRLRKYQKQLSESRHHLLFRRERKRRLVGTNVHTFSAPKPPQISSASSVPLMTSGFPEEVPSKPQESKPDPDPFSQFADESEKALVPS